MVTIALGAGPELYLEIYDVSTGRYLAGTTVEDENKMGLWFTPDGSEVWVGYHEDLSVKGWKIIEDSESGTVELQPLVTQCSPEALPWLSSCGYEVMDDGWVLSPTEKRLI